MNLFTRTEFQENPAKIHHKERILTIGSCFADNIGQKLVENKFDTLCNPFGTVYNPSSISSSIERLLKNSYITMKELQLCQDYHCHLDFHSQFNGIDKKTTLEGINNAISNSHTFVNEGLNWLIISLGTAHVYKHKLSNTFVNNCHKIPASAFERTMMTTSQIVDKLKGSIQNLKLKNADLKVILTVSPIRHLRDGLPANVRSKSRLIEAAHQVTESIPNCSYFPSYEILIDELRDYRWFEEDLIHPNKQAIAYIWNQFKKFALDANSNDLIKKISAIKNNLNHKPFLAESKQYQDFLLITEKKIETLEKEFPHLDFKTERKDLKDKKI